MIWPSVPLVTDEPSEFHTILSETWRPELEASEVERHQIEQHIGKYIVTWCLIDLFLGMAIPAITKPRSRTHIAGEAIAKKVERLRAILPKSWGDGQAMLRLLDDGRDYRNALAHLTLAMGGSDENGMTHGWHLWDVQRKRDRYPLDEEQMARRELDARIAQEAVGCMMADRYVLASSADEFGRYPLAEQIIAQPGQWHTRTEFIAFRSRVRELFSARPVGES